MGFTGVSLMTNDVKHVLICHVYLLCQKAYFDKYFVPFIFIGLFN